MVVQCESTVPHVFCKACIERWAYVGRRTELSGELISTCPTCKGTIKVEQAAAMRKSWLDANPEESLQDAPSSNDGLEDTEWTLSSRDDTRVDGSEKLQYFKIIDLAHDKTCPLS